MSGASTGNPKKAEHPREKTEEIGQQVPTVDNWVQLRVAGEPIRQDRFREEGSTEALGGHAHLDIEKNSNIFFILTLPLTSQIWIKTYGELYKLIEKT